ncbi:amidohydrolase family protein [Tepidimicrobium xylanilyticum]|uniref:Amidohydrolase family protein n=2 Tax=Tepidimicrobium xylanilyticum TaxID=1123352 RepID=A0A1H2T6M8_9FIRM|nr:amidohydrolase family protein [Tepidimicrobium xylanilyticum]SDW39606.1 Amidohydrolase family protein [Tepidimicrobium xylanilyticum]
MTDKVLYKGFTLIDGSGKEPIKNAWFIVEDKRIIEIGRDNDHPNIEDTKVVDLNGKTVMPGLINCHVHITMEPVAAPFAMLIRESDAMTTLRSAANLKKHLRSGTTFFRDLGAPNYIDIDLRDAVNEGIIEGPEFIVAGKCITMTGDHGWSIGREADGVDEVRKTCREQLKAGIDVMVQMQELLSISMIKLHMS